MKTLETVLEWRCARGHRFRLLAQKVVYRKAWCAECRALIKTVPSDDLEDATTIAERLARSLKWENRETVAFAWRALGLWLDPFDPEDHTIARQEWKRVEPLLESLTKRQRRILEARFGLRGAARTLGEIAKEEKLSHERVRQVARQALWNLRVRAKRQREIELGKRRPLAMETRAPRPRRPTARLWVQEAVPLVEAPVVFRVDVPVIVIPAFNPALELPPFGPATKP